MTEVEVRRVAGSTFLAKGSSNHWVPMDAAADNGGHDAAARPMELVLMALGGCTGIDVELMLGKMRVDIDNLRIEIQGERADDHPRVYTNINITYHFWGNDLPMDKLQRAVQLSEEKYCSVTHMLNKTATITTDIQVHSANRRD